MIQYFKCGQHRLHNAEKAATSAELPNLVDNLRIYNRVIRDYEIKINDHLRRIQDFKQTDTTIQPKSKDSKPQDRVKVYICFILLLDSMII